MNKFRIFHSIMLNTLFLSFESKVTMKQTKIEKCTYLKLTFRSNLKNKSQLKGNYGLLKINLIRKSFRPDRSDFTKKKVEIWKILPLDVMKLIYVHMNYCRYL